MGKSDLMFLEKVFAREIDGGFYQSKSKQAKRLEEEGYIKKIDLSQNTPLGRLKAEGYILTIRGNATYCMSDYCLNQTPSADKGD